MSIGEEFFCQATYLDFKEPTTTFPFLRCAALACNLHSPVQKDQIGKLLTKSDLERLKGPKYRATILAAEQSLALNWELLTKANLQDDPQGLSAMGRALIRVGLFVTNKQLKGRERHEFPGLAEISSKFGEEMKAITDGTGAAPAVADHESDEELAAPSSLQEQGSMNQNCCFFIGLKKKVFSFFAFVLARRPLIQ